MLTNLGVTREFKKYKFYSNFLSNLEKKSRNVRKMIKNYEKFLWNLMEIS